MREIRFLCLAVGRRDGGNCIAGIDLDTGQWIRPVRAKTHGAFADYEIIVIDAKTRKPRLLLPLDVLRINIDKYAGNNVQPENWEMVPISTDNEAMVLWHFDERQDAELLVPFLDRSGPLLCSHGDKLSFGSNGEGLLFSDPLLKHKESHSLSIIQPRELYWKVAPHPKYENKQRVQAEFRFDDDPYCLVVTDTDWEAQCRRFGIGRHPHSLISGVRNGQVLLTISLAEKPLNGFHYKLVAGVICLPA